jgi:hypothetical protein
MEIRDLFLEQHAAIHSVAVGGNKISAAERTFGGLSDAQMRVRPREDLQMSKVFPGRPRSAALSGIALFHSSGHMGEASTVRTAGGFGTGV